MQDYLLTLLEQSNTLTLEEISLRIVIAAVIGMVIFLSYLYTHAGSIYSQKFNVSLVMLTILTATVMTVIGNNIALSLGMVGALSIVRYRTAIKDSRDTAYIFWAIVVGISCGAGEYLIGAVGTSVVFIVMLILGRVKNDNRMLLIIRGSRNEERAIESVVFIYFKARAKLKVHNTTGSHVEFIYELPRTLLEKTAAEEKSITEALYEIEDIEYVNLVSQQDEING